MNHDHIKQLTQHFGPLILSHGWAEYARQNGYEEGVHFVLQKPWEEYLQDVPAHAIENRPVKYTPFMPPPLDETVTSMIDEVIGRMKEAEENVLRDVMRQLLKREPVVDDWKALTRIFRQGQHEEYALEYKGVHLGMVKYRMPNSD